MHGRQPRLSRSTPLAYTSAVCRPRPGTLIGLLGALVIVMMTGVAHAADLAEAKARHQLDRSACLRGDTHQDKRTCLIEADAMLAEAKRGNVMVLEDRQYLSNRMHRCEALPAIDREDCLRRMRGEGITTGTVEAGGIYRELSRPEDAPPRR